MNNSVSLGGWLVSLVISLLFAWACAKIAGGKGYSPVLFAVLGFFFSCITLIIALVLPRRNSTT